MRTAFIAMLLGCMIVLPSGAPGQTGSRLLDRYVFEPGPTGGSDLSFTDRHLGNSAVSFSINYTLSDEGNAHMRMRAFRYFPPGAGCGGCGVLIQKIVVIFSNANGSPIRSVVVEKIQGNFVYAFSEDGYFEHSIDVSGLSGVRAVEVRIWGLYFG